jgi:hypothetical protein
MADDAGLAPSADDITIHAGRSQGLAALNNDRRCAA